MGGGWGRGGGGDVTGLVACGQNRLSCCDALTGMPLSRRCTFVL